MTSPPKSLSSTSAVDTVKFLCSYNGKIIPRSSDGQLRYIGGLTRVLSVPRSISFSELSEKLQDLCGFQPTLRCQLPNLDLDVLITIKSDEDLSNIIEEYNKATLISGKELKIRSVLSPPKSQFRSSVSTPASPVSSSSSSPDLSPFTTDPPQQRRWSHRKPPVNLPRRVYQYKVVGDCYHNYYPSHHTQSNSKTRLSSTYFSPQHSNLWH